MNILFLMKVFEVGGQEVVTNTLAQQFENNGHHVTIASFKEPSVLMAKRVDLRIPLFTIGYFEYSSKNVTRIYNIIKERNIDIVINQWGLPYIPSKLLKKVRKICIERNEKSFKIISVYHNSPDINARIKSVEIELEQTNNILRKCILYLKKDIFRCITSFSMRYAYDVSDVYQVLSPSFVDKFRVFTGIKNTDKLMVQTNPITIDASNFLFRSSLKKKEIIYVGRIDYNQKRVYRVIDTWALLEEQYKDWNLTIVGDGISKDNILTQVKKLGLRRVSLEGFKDPKKYYERASILLLTSEYEGFPLVLAECMSFGVVPVVYGSYSAVYDIIKDNVNGLILPFNEKGYNSQAMSERLAEIMSSQQKYISMAKEAIKTSQEYSVDIIYQSWNKLFNELINKL